MEDERLALLRVKVVVKSATGAGADRIVVACPLCHLALDAGQLMTSHSLSAEFGLPVLYFMQLVGLALGESPAKLSLGRHIVPTREVVEPVGAA